jgi:hypothetical protein
MVRRFQNRLVKPGTMEIVYSKLYDGKRLYWKVFPNHFSRDHFSKNQISKFLEHLVENVSHFAQMSLRPTLAQL